MSPNLCSLSLLWCTHDRRPQVRHDGEQRGRQRWRPQRGWNACADDNL